MVNDFNCEHKHTQKDVSKSKHGESCLMYFENGEFHGGNEQKQSSIDGWCCDEGKSRSNSSYTSSSYTRNGSDDNEDTHDVEVDTYLLVAHYQSCANCEGLGITQFTPSH